MLALVMVLPEMVAVVAMVVIPSVRTFETTLPLMAAFDTAMATMPDPSVMFETAFPEIVEFPNAAMTSIPKTFAVTVFPVTSSRPETEITSIPKNDAEPIVLCVMDSGPATAMTSMPKTPPSVTVFDPIVVVATAMTSMPKTSAFPMVLPVIVVTPGDKTTSIPNEPALVTVLPVTATPWFIEIRLMAGPTLSDSVLPLTVVKPFDVVTDTELMSALTVLPETVDVTMATSLIPVVPAFTVLLVMVTGPLATTVAIPKPLLRTLFPSAVIEPTATALMPLLEFPTVLPFVVTGPGTATKFMAMPRALTMLLPLAITGAPPEATTSIPLPWMPSSVLPFAATAPRVAMTLMPEPTVPVT